MKIYIASSWKNEKLCIWLTKALRFCGHEVDCFCDPSSGRLVFSFNELGNVKEHDTRSILGEERVINAFVEDKKWLDWADVVILLLPCGKSAHLEAGYAKGQGKKLYIVGEFQKGEFDVMYEFADRLVHINEIDVLVDLLKEEPEKKEIKTYELTFIGCKPPTSHFDIPYNTYNSIIFKSDKTLNNTFNIKDVTIKEIK